MMAPLVDTTTPAPFIVNDIVIHEDTCNLACTYCLTGQSNFKAGHADQLIFRPPRPHSVEPGTPTRMRLDRMVAMSQDQGIPVVKISGGEVSLLRGYRDFVESLSRAFETVVILTNGVLLTEECVTWLEGLENVVLQISLDAVDPVGNSHRVANEKLHARLMSRIRNALESKLDVEIYMVLNDRSLPTLDDSLRQLAPYGGRVTVFPFPVRGPDRDAFLPRPDQLHHLEAVAARRAEYGPIAPDAPYFDRLMQWFRQGERRFRCHLPRIAFTSFDDGAVTSCPNIWFNKAADFVKDEAATVFAALQDSTFRRLLLADRPRVEACRSCFTPWDPVSLFLDGVISLEQLRNVPIYRGARTQAALAALAERLAVQPTC